MKKISVLILLLLCISAVPGCKKPVKNPTGAYFTAEITAVYETYFLVKVTEPGSCGIALESPVHVSRKTVPEEESFSAGDVIRVSFNGNVMETYPLGLGEIYSVEKIRSASVPDWGIKLSAQDVTCSGMKLICEHSGTASSGSLTTGSYYVIERLKGKDWLRVSYKELGEWEVGWDDVAYTIRENGAVDWEINWEWLYGDLPAGQYRIGREIMNSNETGSYEKAIFYAEFTIE